jgi:hypothetical protein
MAAGSHDRNGMIGRDGIKLLAEGVTPDIKFELIIATPLDPLTGRRGRGALPNPFKQ